MNKFNLLIISTILVLGISLTFYFLRSDTIVYHASQTYPLGSKHIYILKKNDGNAQIPAGVTYLIANPDTKQTHVDFGVSGTVIGKTDIDLEPYVGKRVQIEGYHYDGVPLVLSEVGLPVQYSTGKMAVIYIKKITIVE